MSSAKITPLMRQYFEIREQHPHALLLFQVGDFYELFFEDAKNAAAYLGIALTKRGTHNGEPIPLCGVPVHALDHYLSKLVRGGFHVAICDQLEEATPGKVVRRGVTQVLTPGTITDSKLLDEKSASYLFSFFPGKDSWSLVFGELLTAQLFATQISKENFKALESELVRFFPDEVIVPVAAEKGFNSYFKKQGYRTSVVNDNFNKDAAHEWLKRFESVHKQVVSNTALQQSLLHFYAYLRYAQEHAVEQFKQLHLYAPDDFLVLDAATQHNLELVRNAHDGSRKHTLFSVMDGAATPMGSRMIKKWLMRPLVKHTAIEQRLDAIGTFVEHITLLQKIKSLLSQLGDIERTVGRIGVQRALIPDYVALKRALYIIPALKDVLAPYQCLLFEGLQAQFGNFKSLYQLLDAALYEEDSHNWIIKSGFDQTLDGIRELVAHGAQKIAALESKEQQETGINSLKIRYNNVHGYYIEITNTHKAAVPDRYIRIQTLVGKERYVTPELQQLQHDIVSAQQQIDQKEKQLFESLKTDVFSHIGALRKAAHGVAYLDALFGIASVCHDNNYVRPTFNDSRELIIKDGRHPVVEQVMQTGFIANDTQLDDAQSSWIITGPNMGGKSTYLRQVALMSIMAQIGSYVPAGSANLFILDRIFTRIGAGDNLAHGKSTFLVEMEETASICTQATEKSLVILDEVGRGTSTYDGLALAQAVMEFIHTHIKARCLFATHYHELSLLQKQLSGLVSYHAASTKTEQGIVFLYKMIRGVADGSFGVEVAKLAHLPQSVINRAQAILKNVAQHENAAMQSAAIAPAVHTDMQDESYHRLVQENNQLRQQASKNDMLARHLADLDYDELSPKKAFDLLWKLKEYF